MSTYKTPDSGSAWSEADGYDLYPLYVKLAEYARADICKRQPACEYRDRLLDRYRTIHRELFEARLEALSRKPKRYQRFINQLMSFAE
jgi:hypothetical protein